MEKVFAATLFQTAEFPQRNQNAENNAGGEECRYLAQPFRGDPFGSISRQQVGSDCEETEESGSRGKTDKPFRESHQGQRQRLAGGEDYREPPVGIPISQRQQEKDPDGQSDLIEGGYDPDASFGRSKVFGHLADDGMDVIGIGSHDRRSKRERVFLFARKPRQIAHPKMPNSSARLSSGCRLRTLTQLTDWNRLLEGMGYVRERDFNAGLIESALYSSNYFVLAFPAGARSSAVAPEGNVGSAASKEAYKSSLVKRTPWYIIDPRPGRVVQAEPADWTTHPNNPMALKAAE